MIYLTDLEVKLTVVTRELALYVVIAFVKEKYDGKTYIIGRD